MPRAYHTLKPGESERRLQVFTEDVNDTVCSAFASDFTVHEPDVDETEDHRYDRDEIKPLSF